MKPPQPANTPLQQKTFLVLLVAVTLAFGWVLLPFYGAVFWGVVLAIVFAPLYRLLLLKLGRHRHNLAALITMLVVLLIVVLPLALVSSALVQEGAGLYRRMQSGEISFGRYLQQIVAALPAWMISLLDRFGLGDLGSLQQKISQGATKGSEIIATSAFDIGQNTLDFVVSFFVTLYLSFFLLRDGSRLARTVWEAIPLDAGSKRNLFAKFTTVIRATVKGNILVAIAQGALGGIAFWYLGIHGALLWAVLMAFLSLLPAVGAALVWVPVAIYLLVIGDIWQAVGLIAWGTLVIGLVDNVLRPVLVGKDIKMPDWMVLISTLGGMALFGLNGFVIGPVIAALFMSTWGIFTQAHEEEKV